MIEILTTDNTRPDDTQDIQGLYYQLNPHRKPQQVQDILNQNSNSKLLVYREDDRIKGMACLAWYRVVSGFRGWVEDVVVDQSLRGRGIGKQLMHKVLEESRNLGIDTIFLYTEAEKTTAIRLYEKLGFRKKNSTIYTLTLT